MAVSPRDSHEILSTIGGVYKLQILLEDLLKDCFTKKYYIWFMFLYFLGAKKDDIETLEKSMKKMCKDRDSTSRNVDETYTKHEATAFMCYTNLCRT